MSEADPPAPGPAGSHPDRGALDLDPDYDNSGRVPEADAIFARWEASSATYRARSRGARLDVSYGPASRQRYDLYLSGREGAPLLVYLHGGYWQEGGRELYAFAARPFNQAGVDVAIPSYTLCPQGTVAGIMAELRAFLDGLGRRALLVGHSAGGHLAAALLREGGSAVAVSGVFDLEPLLRTRWNGAMGLDVAAARALSPVRRPPPPRVDVLACVGERESDALREQTHGLARAWGIEALEVSGADHFSVIDRLVDPADPLFERVLDMV